MAWDITNRERLVTNRDAIKTLIERIYEVRRTGDIEGAIAAFHPDGKFELAGSKEHTATIGKAEGHQELRETFAKLIAAFQFVARDIVNLVIEDERAAVHSRVKLRFVPKDRTVTTDLIDLWKFKDGKVLELLEFVDTALINDLMI
jgi:ketosteroid isomerase-like protein